MTRVSSDPSAWCRAAALVLAAAVASLSACGGGGGSSPTVQPPPPPPPPPPPSGGGGTPPTATSVSAATTTASTNAACVGAGTVESFYWEIGDATGKLAGGSVGSTTYQAGTKISIASASKWFYSTYHVEKKGGALTAEDIQFLNFQSGYTYFAEPPGCTASTTVDGCLAQTDKSGNSFNAQDPATVGKFDYGGGHMQKHASLNGLGGLNNAALAAELKTKLGTDIDFSYGQPQLAGGITTSATEYGKLLRKIIDGTLPSMKAALGTHPVCTNTDIAGACPNAVFTPSPRGEQWHYSVGHWVEDDPKVGDGSFSSPGAFGFYPWIDSTKSWYGVVSTLNLAGAIDSVRCGRLIRKAWMTGVVQ